MVKKEQFDLNQPVETDKGTPLPKKLYFRLEYPKPNGSKNRYVRPHIIRPHREMIDFILLSHKNHSYIITVV